jgi:hypothetical protein
MIDTAKEKIYREALEYINIYEGSDISDGRFGDIVFRTI